MEEQWLLDHVRDRLATTAAMTQRLHDKLRFGLVRPDEVVAALALILVHIDQAITLVEELCRTSRDAQSRTPTDTHQESAW